MSKKTLSEIAMIDDRWKDAAQSIITGHSLIESLVQEEAVALKHRVLESDITMAELRGGVAWANALDYEAVELYGTDLLQGEQYYERTARRVMHLAGRLALNTLKNNHRRTIAHVVGKRMQNLV